MLILKKELSIIMQLKLHHCHWHSGALNHSLFPFYVLVSLQYTCIDNQNNHCNCFSSHKIYYMHLFTRLFSQNIYEEYRLPLLHDVSNLLCIMNIFCKISNTENLKFAGKLSHSMPWLEISIDIHMSFYMYDTNTTERI